MAERSKIRVTPTSGGNAWTVKRDGADRASGIHDTKSDAVEQARGIAKREQPSQVIIHKKDGTIQEERTYQKDPFPPKG